MLHLYTYNKQNRRVGEFSGREAETLLPGWSLDCVWSGQYSTKEQPTVHFFVMPHPTAPATASTAAASNATSSAGSGSTAAGGSTSSSHSASSATSKQVLTAHISVLVYIYMHV
jgi:hypothetical protein